MDIKENENIFTILPGVFYNPAMILSRSVSSSILEVLNEELNILDCFSASGIRGLRYKLENKNVNKIGFVDISNKAIENIKQNLNNLGINGKIYHSNVENVFEKLEEEYNFIELDPFGSPAPYTKYAVNYLKKKRGGYLSITATDTAVLCGKDWRASIKYYNAMPLRNYFCHETGLRILFYHLVSEAFKQHMFVEPIISFYYRHQMKIIIKLSKRKNDNLINSIGYVFWNKQSLKTDFKKIYETHLNLLAAGPLWIDRLENKEILNKALKRTDKKTKIFIEKLIYEDDSIPYFYSLHAIGKMLSLSQLPKVKDVIKILGGNSTITHFRGDGIKTKEYEKLIKLFK